MTLNKTVYNFNSKIFKKKIMKISIIEDEKILAQKTAKKLEKNLYSVEIFDSFNDFKENYKFDSNLYIVDIWLPDWNWFDIIKWLREEKKLETPILITSWYADNERKIYWLNIWADDYITKPYFPDELIARVNWLIRRSYKTSNESSVKYKNFEYFLHKNTLAKNWKEIFLTSRETSLIEYMLLNKWKLVKKIELINSVWWEYKVSKISDNNINVTLSRVRKKLGRDFKLKTFVNKWYILEE